MSPSSNVGDLKDKNKAMVVSAAERATANKIDIDTQSEITNISSITCNSQPPLTTNTAERILVETNACDPSIITLPNCPRVNNTGFSVTNVFRSNGRPCRPLKKKVRFLSALCGLTYRLLISLSLTLFMAVFVLAAYQVHLMVDLGQFTPH